MSEIKIYRIIGNYNKNHKKYLFRKEVRALKEEDALEKVLTQITSIGIYRRQINIQEVIRQLVVRHERRRSAIELAYRIQLQSE